MNGGRTEFIMMITSRRRPGKLYWKQYGKCHFLHLTAPSVVVALSKVDTYTDEKRGLMRSSKDNVVLTITADQVDAKSFVLHVHGGKTGGGNNHLFDADVSWIACA